jgi:phytoene dehydrogenase-like protein
MTTDLIRQADLSQVRETLMRHITLMQDRLDKLEAAEGEALSGELPVGTIYMSYSKDFDPNVHWPGTVWENFGYGLASPMHYISGTGSTFQWPTNKGTSVNVSAIGCTIWHRTA